MPRFLFIAMLAFVSTSLAAMEIPGSGSTWRVSLGTTPGIEEWEQEGVTYNENDDAGINLEVAYYRASVQESGFGFIWGPKLFYRTHDASGEFVGGTLDYYYATLGIGLNAGVIYHVTHDVSLELKPFIDLGFGNINFDDDNDDEDFYEPGAYVAFGADLGVFYHFGPVHLGLEAGYMDFTGKSTLEVPGFDDSDLEVTGSGASFKLSIGGSF